MSRTRHRNDALTPALAANTEGMVLWMSERTLPHRTLRWHLYLSGALLEGPIEEFPADPARTYHQFELVPRSGGFALAARTHGDDRPKSISLQWLDPRGAPLPSRRGARRLADRLTPYGVGSSSKVNVRV